MTMVSSGRSLVLALQDHLIDKVEKAYKINTKHGKRMVVVDVTDLDRYGNKARIEPDEPKGNRRCFDYKDVLICSSDEKKLDWAEQILFDPDFSRYIDMGRKLYQHSRPEIFPMRPEEETDEYIRNLKREGRLATGKILDKLDTILIK